MKIITLYHTNENPARKKGYSAQFQRARLVVKVCKNGVVTPYEIRL